MRIKAKKTFITLASVISLVATLPTTGFAAPVSAENYAKAIALPGFGDVSIQQILLSESGYLPYDGEVEYTFDYETTYGNTIRYYLSDDENVGLTIKIYDASNSLVASGHTESGNSWQVLNTFTPASSNQTYTVRIVSDDGDGFYGYSVAVRAY
ncbi:hypothetical protein [Paenibacillus sp. YN15]|uniref:hypothetical protein n=1 Tax=Paenibacillus sp. YN15 TaxID=1742774 RepID=UPI000DCB4D1C|nr:hypothetical protein [Paenibacillus sp. YN15]RAU96863.1 hypothetical protein DQG13_20140 [Paenibacillus sp. YN15]